MKYYALDSFNRVCQIVVPPEGFTIADMFIPEIAETFYPVPEGVEIEVGYTRKDDGTFSPVPMAVPETVIMEQRISDLEIAIAALMGGAF